MIRKFLLFVLICIGTYGIAGAQTEDSVRISLPFGDDTTCPGWQLRFTAVETNDTAVGTTFAWFHNDIYTGVALDTFYTTAPVDGDYVYARIYFTNSLGLPDTAQSNTIIVHRSSSIMPGVVIALTAGSNPGCPDLPLTFTAMPINGGTAPQYQWYIDNMEVSGATSATYTNVFADGDSVTCRVVSNSPCAAPTDTAYSNMIEVIRDSLTATVSISVMFNPICEGHADTLTATVGDAGIGSSVYWFVNGSVVTGVAGPIYPTDTLHNADIIHAMLVAPDACVINDTTISDPITMTVVPNLVPHATLTLTSGANPGCLDSAITFTATVTGSGTAPDLIWLVNDTSVATGSTTHTQTYISGDLLTFRVIPTDGGCYTADSFTTPAVLMIRDSTPVAPLVSLIDNMLVANTEGTYIWYYNGAVIPGANAQTYHPPAAGYYYAVMDTGNCPSKPSNVIYISLLDVKNIVASSVKIYPNPTSGIITLSWADVMDADISVYDVVGRAVMSDAVHGAAKKDLDMSSLPAGNYVVSLRDKEGVAWNYKVQVSR